MNLLSVSDVARKLDARPQDITDLFYRRILDDKLCPVVAHRRVIPAEYVDMIRDALAERGKLPECANA